jgi:hypothetical protein
MVVVNNAHIPVVVVINLPLQHRMLFNAKLSTKPYGVSVLRAWLCPTGHGTIEVQPGGRTLAHM